MQEGESGTVPAIPTIMVSHGVIAEIAGQTALAIDGVAELGGNLVTGLQDMLGRHAATHGVRVDVSGGEVEVSMYMLIEYGVRIPDIAQRVQEEVKRQIEKTTGLRVKRVDIHIQGVAFPSPPGSGVDL